MPDTVNETAAENRRYGDPVCIDAMRVYDSCGDKDCLSDMPVFFSDASWVGTLMYFAGILIIFLGALLVNKIAGHKPRKSYFIIELPEYKIPSLWRAFKSMCGRGWAYILKAATIILLCNTVVQIMQSFDWSFSAIAEGAENTSILASIATPFAYILIPIIGYYSWQLAAAAVTGFIAKENVVGTLAVCFGISNLINIDELALEEGADVMSVASAFGSGEVAAMSAVAALAYLMFNLFTPPCFAAIGAMNSEMKSAKWLWGGIGLQFNLVDSEMLEKAQREPLKYKNLMVRVWGYNDYFIALDKVRQKHIIDRTRHEEKV